MSPLIHFLASLLLSLLLFPFYGSNALFVFVGGFLIDLDHLTHYYSKLKKWGFIEAYTYYKYRTISVSEFEKELFLLHTIEFLVLCAFLSFYYRAFLIITLGLLLHHFLDFLNEFFVVKCHVKARSLILWVVRAKST